MYALCWGAEIIGPFVGLVEYRLEEVPRWAEPKFAICIRLGEHINMFISQWETSMEMHIP